MLREHLATYARSVHEHNRVHGGAHVFLALAGGGGGAARELLLVLPHCCLLLRLLLLHYSCCALRNARVIRLPLTPQTRCWARLAALRALLSCAC